MPPSTPIGQRFRVLLVIDTFPPVDGGSEIEAQRVSAALIARGHRVQVVCKGGAPMPGQRDWVDPLGIPVRIVTRRSQGKWKDRVFALQVARAIWSFRKSYDAVYFLMQGLHLSTGLPMAHLLRKPIVMKFSGSSLITNMRASRIGRLELRWLRQWARRIMILNDGMVQEAVDAGLPKELLTWMPNPVDVDLFRPAAAGEGAAWRRRQGLPESSVVALYVGRLSHEKGLIPLIRGFAAVAAAAPDAVLVLVGDGPQRADLEALARELELPPARIRFTGRIPNTQVPDWLRSSDVFALTSPAEGFSCSLVEAMAAGVPSVVSDIPANRQLVEPGVHGLAVAHDDPAGIGRALLELFGDPGLRLKMGRAARERAVENYSTARVIDRYEKLFTEVINQR